MGMPTLHRAAGFLLGHSVYPPLLAPKWADLAKIILQHALTREEGPCAFFVPILQSQVLGHPALSGKKRKMSPPKTQRGKKLLPQMEVQERS